MLKGTPPAKVENHENTVTIENAEGQRLTVQTPNAVFLVDQRIDNSICHIVERADELAGVSGISIAHGNTNPVRIPKADFQTFAKKIDISKIGETEKTGKTIQEIRKNEILFIRKPDLLGSSQWQFKSDTQFQASINDLTFLEQVHSGQQSIAAKMYIVADVLVTMELGEDGLPDERKQHYSIEKVHSIQSLDNDQMRLE